MSARGWTLAVAFAAALGAAGCELRDDDADDAPAILWTAMRPHADRGECTNCHVRLDLAGNPLPMIPSWARMPHPDRGVCTNCHVIAVAAPVQRIARAQPEPSAIDRLDWLGMQLRAVVPGEAAGRAPAGLLVLAVTGTAERAGVQPGDLLTAVNGAGVATFADLRRAPVAPAAPVRLLLLRQGQPLGLDVVPTIEIEAIRQTAALATPPIAREPAVPSGTPRSGIRSF